MPGYCTPNNNNFTNNPGTGNPTTHSFGERLTRVAEFDDALLDQAAWKNSRYAGSRLIAKSINRYTPMSTQIDTVNTSSGEVKGKYITLDGGAQVWGGDESWQSLPVLNNLSTALYIANTVVGGEENDNYVTIKNHSYVGISQILLINLVDDSVQLIDRTAMPYQDFHRFITNDFPTGNSATVKVIEDQTENVPNNLQGIHRVKMNKGYLLKTFTYKAAGEASGSYTDAIAGNYHDTLYENNAMYLFTGIPGTTIVTDNLYMTGSFVEDAPTRALNRQLRFKYANFEAYQGGTAGQGHDFNMRRFGPKFNSSSIHENRFTQQFYSGSYGIIGGVHSSSGQNSILPADIMLTSSWGQATKFLALDCLQYLTTNNGDTSLTQNEKTEMHVTFFQGTKDFTKGLNEPVSKHDERSIGTFEVDQNRANLMIEQGDDCNGGLPVNHELVFKGPYDNRFMPTTNAYKEDIQTAHLQNVSKSVSGYANATDGCATITRSFDGSAKLGSGITLDRFANVNYYVQGGALGWKGLYSTMTSSTEVNTSDPAQVLTFHRTNLYVNRADNDNYYSGSFHYEVSFLDKDHTLIMNINKETELPDGIGDKGLVIVPQFSHPQVAFNIDYYLQKAGIANTGITIPQNTTLDTNPNVPDIR